MQLPQNRILCIDDHEDSRILMKLLLEKRNCGTPSAKVFDNG